MTHPTPPQQSSGQSLYSPDQLLKPQGLKPDSHVSADDYLHLGFNPTPGSLDAVHDLKTKLHKCADVLHEARKVVTGLLNGSYWKGDAAVAFREQVEGGPLPLNLKNAAHSLDKAVTQLGKWHDELDDFQRRAKRLEAQAKTAQAALADAQHRAHQAANDPDLDKHGHRHDDAKTALKQANGHVNQTQADLDDIIAKAKRLAHEHEDKSAERARKIQNATEKLAPHEPGTWAKIWDWTVENLPDILSTAAAIVGLAALIFLTGGAFAVALLVVSALSATALAFRVADPAVRASLWDGVSKGELDSDFWGNAIAVSGDVLGVIPGLGATGKGAANTLRAIRASEEVVPLGQKISLFGSKSMEQARSISELENPILNFVVRGARDPGKTGGIVEITSASLGVATAGYGLVSKAVEAADNDAAGNSATGIDGGRLGLDGGAIISFARYVFS